MFVCKISSQINEGLKNYIVKVHLGNYIDRREKFKLNQLVEIELIRLEIALFTSYEKYVVYALNKANVIYKIQ